MKMMQKLRYSILIFFFQLLSVGCQSGTKETDSSKQKKKTFSSKDSLKKKEIVETNSKAKDIENKEVIVEKKQTNKSQFIDPFTGMKFVKIPGGTFTMGCTYGDEECFDNEFPRHKVTVSPFFMGKYEVTQAEWKAVMGSNPSFFSGCPSCPVENVSWYDVQAFIKELNAQTGMHYRLPTEAEWEYAARGGSNSQKYAGSNTLNNVGWYDDNSGEETHLVGRKSPNAYNLYDMTGNVWEWCNDWSDFYSSENQNNPKGPRSGVNRAIRGGSWNFNARNVRVSYRCINTPSNRFNGIGFRLVYSLR